ncbi:MAG: helix-turn-helix domain-containing protein [Acidimicrobiales bacterium]|jgi:excisionase family DNA binding protein
MTTFEDTRVPDCPSLDVDDVASRFQVSPKTIRRRVADGSLPHYRIGRLVRFTSEDLRSYIARCRVPAAS